MNKERIVISLNEKVLSLIMEKTLNIEKLTLLIGIYNKLPKVLDIYFSLEKNLDSFIEYKELELLGYLVKNEEKSTYSLTQYGLNFVKKYIEIAEIDLIKDVEELTEPMDKGKKDAELFLFCCKYANLFTKNKLGISGKYQRPEEIIAKMSRWKKQFPQYTEQQIIDCVENYIKETKTSSGTCKYIMEAGYLIYKRKDMTKESEESKLASLLVDFTAKKEDNIEDTPFIDPKDVF